MKISVPDILSKSSKKLLALYPQAMQMLWDRKDAKRTGTKPEKLPVLPIFVITGSRYGGKSEFVYRATVSGILDGYVDSAILCTITEEGSKNSSNLFDKILAEADEEVYKSRESDHPVRVLSGGEEIYFDFLNRTDAKARQQKADILIIEELEKWNATDGYASLLTMIRHFDLVFVISNKLPTWADNLLKAFNPIYTRIDYFENPMCDPTIFNALEKIKHTDPQKWNNFIMYSDEGLANRVYSEDNIKSLFMPINPQFSSRISLLSIDVGGGGADNSTIFLLSMDENGFIEGKLLMDESVEAYILLDRVKEFRYATYSKEEVWDVQGVGLGIAQMRFHKNEWAKQGLIPFFGKAVDTDQYFNARSESIILTRELLQRGGLVITGLTGDQIEELTEEMRATTYDMKESSHTQKNMQTKITKKDDIKKSLGRSPNKLDALTMGVWRLMTFHRKKRISTSDLTSSRSMSNMRIKGIPGLD